MSTELANRIRPAKFTVANTANHVDIGDSAMSAVRGLLVVTMALSTFGLTMLYSASSADLVRSVGYFKNQLMWFLLGCTGGVIVFLCGYRWLAKNSKFWMFFCAFLLLIAFKFGREINGAHRWIQFAGFTIQPSEFAKIAVALFVANYCTDNLRSFSNFRGKHGILPMGITLSIVILLIFAGRDLGTTLLVGCMAFLTLVVAGLRWFYYVVPALFLTAVGFYIVLFDHNRLLRITSFLRPETVKSGAGYQLLNSLMALGSGGWLGIGLMEGRMKARYLPEAHTDFILAVVGEELGLLAIIGVLILYSLWGYFALRIVFTANSRLGMLLGWALTLGIMLQAAINLLVISGLAPTKGMPAPFISYGGSNLVGCLIGVGLLVSIAVESADPGYNRRIFAKLGKIFNRNQE